MIKKRFEVNCLGWCNKSFMSIDPKTNRLCLKCTEKMKVMTNDFGKQGTKERRIIIED